MVRITGGTHRGQIVHVPANGDVRPTAGRVREAVFNILGSRLPGAWVVDLFAGSGLLGLEAISRGAKFVAFVDSNPTAFKMIQQNVNRLQLAHHATVIKGSVPHPSTLTAIEKLFHRDSITPDIPLAIVFMDPPYGQNLIPETLTAIGNSNFAVSGTLAVAEHEAGMQFEGFSSWEPLQYRRYGDTRISIFKKIGREK
ncbi:MAG: N6-adenine-specific methylase [Magnetococcales bacterium]|nr:N6-adenine-specific methylase [Magnetococcales bacterium]HIJ82886.1 16S rRNA (guanine(966)-N(2))-methyltransferase RsmD [Magnetococcales bacterium]